MLKVSIFICIVVVAVILCYIFFTQHKKKLIDSTYSCPEGEFRICGKKEDFKIYKDDRFVFHVINGQIASFVDSINKNTVRYGGDLHVDS